jgi:hypothetical protein
LIQENPEYYQSEYDAFIRLYDGIWYRLCGDINPSFDENNTLIKTPVFYGFFAPDHLQSALSMRFLSKFTH